MSRRAHRKTPRSTGIWLFGAVLILGISGIFISQKNNDPYQSTEALKPGDYLENANSLRGNTYRLEGVIAASLGWSQEKGRLFSIRVSQGEKDSPLPILVPTTFREINLQKGQRYRLKVRVNDLGLLEVEEMSKI